MRSLLLLLAAALLACAHTPKDKTICPEHRSLTCVGGVECTMDQTRGCRVCQCVGHNTYDPGRPENYQGQPDRTPK
jgi:hypothetical protein